MPKPVHRPHLPQRPIWRCKACGYLWPCDTAKADLLAEFRGYRTSLLLYLAAQMVDARDDLAELDSGTPPEGLTDRFLGWASVRE